MSPIDEQHIGVDLGDQYSQACVLADDGTILEEARVRSTIRAFERFFSKFEPSVVVMEAGTHSRWSSAQLQQLGHEVVVANPARIRLIHGGSSKSDRLDAAVLARLGRLDRSLLRPIQHRGRQAHADLAWIRGRDRLVQARTRLVKMRVARRGDWRSCDQ